MLSPGRFETADQAGVDRVAGHREHDRIVAVAAFAASAAGMPLIAVITATFGGPGPRTASATAGDPPPPTGIRLRYCGPRRNLSRLRPSRNAGTTRFKSRRQTTEKSNQGQGRLLCARRKRPSCAPDERNQLAPSNMNCHVWPSGREACTEWETISRFRKDEQCLCAAKVLNSRCLRWVIRYRNGLGAPCPLSPR